MKRIRTYIALLLSAAIALSVVGCAKSAQEPAWTARAADLMDGVTPNSVAGKPTDSAFVASMADFSIRLFSESFADGESSLISPLSVMLALAMTANGADNATLAQMEEVLGGGIPIAELNGYLHSYINRLPSAEDSKLNIANSIWFRDSDGAAGLLVEPDFLQTNADYYNASLFRAAFDNETLRDVNDWVSTNTDGMIDGILSEINADDVMYLINAIAFDAEWAVIYASNEVREGIFTDIGGNEQNVDFMHSTEWLYLDDGLATGFVKHYANGYAFAALLPNEGVTLDGYIGALTGEGFMHTLENAQNVEVRASMPKFEYEYSIRMNGALETLGMADAFSEGRADFRRIGSSTAGDLFISEVQHKTFISVDERGTRAGAATLVAVTEDSAPAQEPKVVQLDRPFVFAIIDSATNLPVFIGTLMTVSP